MAYDSGGPRSADRIRYALLIVIMMFTSVNLNLLVTDLAEAHQSHGNSSSTIYSWPLSGYNDTGWVTLEATNADPSTGQFAIEDWNVLFPPGAEVSNVSMEIMVNGSDGISIYEPHLFGENTGDTFFDWTGNGGFGTQDNFMMNNPHTGRLAPNSDAGATWMLPAGASVTDLVFEALSPMDPVVSFSPLDFKINDYEIDPNDGRMYAAIGSSVIQLDFNSNPHVIHFREFQSSTSTDDVEVYDVEIDTLQNLLIVATTLGVTSYSLDDGQEMQIFPPKPSSQQSVSSPFKQIEVTSSGLFGIAEDGLFTYSPFSNAWILERSAGTANWPYGTPMDTLELSGDLMVALQGGGVASWDLVAGSPNPLWNSANNLPSDNAFKLLVSGGDILVATTDAGVGRYDYVQGFWKSPWTTSNGLSSNSVRGLEYSISNQGNYVAILTEEDLDIYNTLSGAFEIPYGLSTLNLYAEGNNLLIWPSNNGERSPNGIADNLLVSDGSGKLARLTITQSLLQTSTVYQSEIVLASGPSSNQMTDVVQAGNAVWVGIDTIIDRYDTVQGKWLESIPVNSKIVALASDGTTVYAATENYDIIKFSTDPNTGLCCTQSSLNTGEEITEIVWEQSTGMLVTSHLTGSSTSPEYSIKIINPSTLQVVSTWDSASLDEPIINDIAVRDSIIYVATQDNGIIRIDMSTASLLSPWISTGLDNLKDMPIAAANGNVYLGLYDFGVMVLNQTTGEMSDLWEDAGQSIQTIPNNAIISLHADVYGNIYVGTEEGGARFDTSGGWTDIPVQQGGSGWGGTWYYDNFVSFDSDNSWLWAAFGEDRICRWDLNTLQGGTGSNCFDEDDGLPSESYTKVRYVGQDRLFVGSLDGAVIFDTQNETIEGSWDLGQETLNAITAQIGDTIYTGYYGIGVTRYDISTNNWLSTWNNANGILSNNDVTALEVDVNNPNNLWIGGSFGLMLINSSTNVVEESFPPGTSNSGNVDLPSESPQELIIHNNIMYYVTYHDGWDENGVIARLDLASMTSLSDIDVGQKLGDNAWVHSAGMSGDILLIGVSEANWQNPNPGGIFKWNTSSNNWDSSGHIWEPTTPILRVNANVIGNYMYVAYGTDSVKQFDLQGNLVNEWDSNTLRGPIRDIEGYNGLVLFATYEGIARYDPTNATWLQTMDTGDGSDIDGDGLPDSLPSESEEVIAALEVVNGDIWYSAYNPQWWNGGTNSRVFRYDSSASNWDNWEDGSQGLPDGVSFSFRECSGVLHIGMIEYGGNSGGVGRYELATDSWEPEWNRQGGQGQNNGLLSNDVMGLACDDSGVVYVGFGEASGGGNGQGASGVSRYSYSQSQWLSELDSSNGIYEDAVFYDAMDWMDGELVIGHDFDSGGQGGISRILVNGTSVGTGQHFSTDLEASTAIPNQGNSLGKGWIIGRPGSDSGFSRVDWLAHGGQLSQGKFDAQVGITSGVIVEIESNGTHVYVVPAESEFDYAGRSVLEGLVLPNGSVEWTRAWSFSNLDIISEIEFVGTELWITTNGLGMWKVDLNTGAMSSISSGISSYMDGLHVNGDILSVGIVGTSSSSAGLQVYNISSSSWISGSLLAGLPSDNIKDGAVHLGKVWFATDNGVGIWDIASQEWDDALTVLNGLPTPIIDEIYLHTDSNGVTELWMATPVGIVRYNPSNSTFSPTIDRLDGLVGNRVNRIAEDSGNLFLSHNGAGMSRPGASSIDLSTLMVEETYRIDQLPSNNVISLASDLWGVHIATDTDPMTHWNAATNQFEDGTTSWQYGSWPPRDMASDGSNLFVLFGDTLARVNAQSATHGIRTTFAFDSSSSKAISVGQNGIFVVGTDGMWGWEGSPTYDYMDRTVLRRAIPLSAIFSGVTKDLTNSIHPGQSFVFVSSNYNPITIEPTIGAIGENSYIREVAFPLILTSDVSNSPTWVSSVDMNYTGIWNLTEGNNQLDKQLQDMLDISQITISGMEVTFRLTAPANGSMMVRLTYDWVRTQTPVSGISLIDRPDDGGKHLEAKWSNAPDPDFAKYNLYLKEGGWDEHPLDISDLAPIPDATSNYWGKGEAIVNTAEGAPLVDGIEYWAVVVVEYLDGSFGMPSHPFGPATPTDEIPYPPEWADAGPSDGGMDGDLYVEWGGCTSIDFHSTRIYISNQLISNALGLNNYVDIISEEGNTTLLQVQPGLPYWLALTCVDDAGQHDPANATVIGPIVPAGGLNDGISPEQIEDIEAFDTPNDEGGRITVKWTPSNAEDCILHTVLIMDSTDSEDEPTTAEEFEVATVVTDCVTEEVVISAIGDQPLMDGKMYYITVVAADKWLNEDKVNVQIVEAIPLKNQMEATNPDKVMLLDAWDVQDDDGTAINVGWASSEADDFSHYVVWASSAPVDDLREAWELFGEDPSKCACIRVDNQWNEEMEIPLTIVMNKAIYSESLHDDKLLNAEVLDIYPDEKLYVTVTVHDIKGNVWLNDLPWAEVTPVDNRDDTEAPDRIVNLELIDRPNDDGTSLELTFEKSTSSDVMKYAVYADTYDFNSVGDANNPSEPIFVLERDTSKWNFGSLPNMPIIVDRLSGGGEIIPMMKVYVAVVAIDSNDNSHTTDLISVDATTKDNRNEDPGAYLPDVEGVQANWVEGGTSIYVQWDSSSDITVTSYMIYISNEEWTNTMDALYVGTATGSNIKVSEIPADPTSNELFSTIIDNSTEWWIAVVAADDTEHRHIVAAPLPVKLSAYVTGSNTDVSDQEAAEGTPFNVQILTDPTMIITIALILAILVVLLLIYRTRGNKKKDGWEYEATWGINQNQGDAGWDNLVSNAPATPPPTNNDVQTQQAVAPPTPSNIESQPEQTPNYTSVASGRTYSVRSDELDNIASDLFDEQEKEDDKLDTSFLDDLL